MSSLHGNTNIAQNTKAATLREVMNKEEASQSTNNSYEETSHSGSEVSESPVVSPPIRTLSKRVIKPKKIFSSPIQVPKIRKTIAKRPIKKLKAKQELKTKP